MSTTTATKSKPMIFQAHSVRAIIDGRKMQTRRVMNPQPPARVERLIRQNDDAFVEATTGDMPVTGEWSATPQYAGGSEVWVKEKWRTHERDRDGVDGIQFADGAFVAIENARVAADAWVQAHDNGEHGEGWRSPRFMPRWASRLTLRIVAVRCERLQAITVDDVWAEGLPRGIYRHANKRFNECSDGDEAMTPDGRVFKPIAAFAQTWDAINGTKAGMGWEANPWVFVYTFAPAGGAEGKA